MPIHSADNERVQRLVISVAHMEEMQCNNSESQHGGGRALFVHAASLGMGSEFESMHSSVV